MFELLFERRLAMQANTIRASAPTRIDLAGGWTDVPSFANVHEGEVVAFAIHLRASAKVQRTLDGRLRGCYESSTPVGGGLGTTGSVNVALMAAMDAGKSKPEDIAERAFNFESLIGNSGGRQDQYMSAFGGFNNLAFNRDGVRKIPMEIPENFRSWLRQNLLLFDTKIPHKSGSLHDCIWRRFVDGDEDVINALHGLKEAA